MNNWLNIIQNKLLPPRCILCGRPGLPALDICAECFADLPRNEHCCYRCGEHFEMAVTSPQLCGRCLAEPPDFDLTYAPFLHQGTVRYLITQLKFHHQFKNARLLAYLLAKHMSEVADGPECLIPVPLHPRRYRQRSFNQSIELARHLSTVLDLPLDLHSCIRQRDTAHQISLPAKQRLKNMRHAFSVVRPIDCKHVAIVDDVMTTGATTAALARAIKLSGVSRVDVWVCARA